MATGGVEIERGNVAAGIVRDTKVTQREAVVQDAKTTQREGIVRDAKVAQRESIAGAAPEDPSHIAFEALVIEAARRDKSTTSRSLRQRVADFVEPRISDPTPFLGGRSLSILERLASDVLPGLDESEELRSLAGDIIADEIDRHRELLLRLQSDIAL
jgi:hypothetical protein